MHAKAALAPAEKLRDHYRMANALWANESVARLAGRWADALVYSDACLSVAPKDPRFMLTRALMEMERGEAKRGNAFLDVLVHAFDSNGIGPGLESATVAIGLPLAGRITGITQRLDLAEAAAERVLSSRVALPILRAQAHAGLGLIAVTRRDRERAVASYRALQPLAGSFLRGLVHVDRLLGLFAATTDDARRTVEHFERALASCRAAGYRVELAWTCFDYAHWLAGQGDEPNQGRVQSLMNEAASIASDLGMGALKQRMTANARVTGWRALSSRETQVLELIAQGMTNQEIAESLSVSFNTVLHHVTNILAKTGASNRAEAAAFATRNVISDDFP